MSWQRALQRRPAYCDCCWRGSFRDEKFNSRNSAFLGKITEDMSSSIAQAATKTIFPSVASLFFRQGDQQLKPCAGTIIDPDGTILTHARSMGSPKSAEELSEMRVAVNLDHRAVKSGDFSFEGTVINADFINDIAIVKVSNSVPLPAAKLGTSQNLYLRDMVVSAASYVDSYHSSVSQFMAKEGRLNRVGTDLIVFPSVDLLGGPVVNWHGEVVGVITHQKVKATAVRIEKVYRIMEHFKKYGRVIQPWIGLNIADPNEKNRVRTIGGDNASPINSEGIRVHKVTPGSPADRAGFCPGDIVMEFGGKCVKSSTELDEVLWDKVGIPLEVVVRREADSIVSLTVVPDEGTYHGSFVS